VTVFAFTDAKDNAELIAQCAELGYLREEWMTLDPTYRKGRFWKKWRPKRLYRHDIDPAFAPDGPMDFTAIQYLDGTFSAVTFDPPYKLNGTGGSHASDEGYGVAWKGVPRAAKYKLAMAGALECIRVLEPGGYLLWKCQDQVESGHKQWQTRIFADWGEANGCRLVDMLHLPSYRAQPDMKCLACDGDGYAAGLGGTVERCAWCDGTGRVTKIQEHSRQNYSTMLILQKES
jgi:hypothetical protein